MFFFFESLFFALCLHKQTQKIFCNKNRQKGLKSESMSKTLWISINSVYIFKRHEKIFYTRDSVPINFLLLLCQQIISGFFHSNSAIHSILSVFIFNFIIHVFAECEIHTNTLDTFVLIISVRLVWSFYTQNEYGTNGATDDERNGKLVCISFHF